MAENFEDILTKENITMEDLREFQRIYDERFVDEKFTGFEKVRHTALHLGKLLGRLTGYCEAMEDGGVCSPEEIRKKVIPDLLVYAFWLAKDFDVLPVPGYFERMIGNMERLYADKCSKEEIRRLRSLLSFHIKE